MIMVVVGGEVKDNNDNGGCGGKGKPRRRLPQKDRMSLAFAPWSGMYYTITHPTIALNTTSFNLK